MCQRLNTGESNNFYFGTLICIGPLNDWKRLICDCSLKNNLTGA